MSWFKRVWGYFATLFKRTTENAMDPEIEIEQAINNAKKQDQQLRNQAAKVVAHRTQLESKMEKAADAVGENREMAKQAILRVEDAKAKGDVEGQTKWVKTAQALAMKLQASENNLNTLKVQYETAAVQADKAKAAVTANAMKVQELAAKQMELLGTLQAAKMQESVNKAVDTMSNTMDYEAPSLEKVEEKIEKRQAEAMAKAELRDSTPDGAEAELKEAINMVQADAKLEELKAELGITE